MSVRAVLLDAKKALGALAVGEAAAVEAGLIGGATAGYVTAGLGVASAVVVYLLRNGTKQPTVNVTVHAPEGSVADLGAAVGRHVATVLGHPKPKP